MSMAAAIQPLGGGAPAPDAARVAAIRAAMAEDAEAGATFAEPPRAALAALVEQSLTASSAAPHAEAATLLAVVRDRVAGLDPTRLEPRKGLAGLFDSRGKRLNRFRAAFNSAADASVATAADLMERAGTIERRNAELETVWTAIREAVTDLDAHIAAARDALTWHPAPVALEEAVPPEASAAFEDAVEQSSDAPTGSELHPSSEDGPVERQADAEADGHVIDAIAGTATPPEQYEVPLGEPATETGEPLASPIATLPHPLEARLQTLLALRATAVARLPLIRAGQNADQGVPEAVASARTAISAWAAETREALGLSGKRHRKVRPDVGRLTVGRDALVALLSSTETVVAVAQTRLRELDARVMPAVPQARIAA